MTKEKTTFITPFGIFCYTKMAFELKNGGTTYQRDIQIILESQIGRNVEAYIDDVVVKSKRHGDLFGDFKETFDNLRQYKMMLNPKKCVFGVSSANCSTTWHRHGGSMCTPRGWKPLNNCYPLEPKEKSRT
jgi:hypothetical protein